MDFKSTGGAHASKNLSTPADKGICFNCDQPGHYMKDCKEPKRIFTCAICKLPGHVASKCTRKDKSHNIKSAKNDESIPKVNVIIDNNNKSTYDSGGKFIREVNINSSKICALIDMGASICTIKCTVVIRESFRIINTRSLIKGFGGQEIESFGIITEQFVIDNLKPGFLSFRIVPDTAQEHDCIIGRPFTEADDIMYTRVGKQLVFEDVDVASVNKKPMEMRSTEKLTLKPGTVNFINVQANNIEIPMPIINLDNKECELNVNEKVNLIN